MRVMILGSGTIIQRLSPSLARWGIEARSTSDGSQAMALLTQEKFDLAAVDGLVDGAEAACRSISECGDIPVVLIVSQQNADWERLESLDIDGYIPGGVDGDELAARLRAVVRRRAVQMEQLKISQRHTAS
jgi:DNA-binding response OmpR family regulator